MHSTALVSLLRDTNALRDTNTGHAPFADTSACGRDTSAIFPSPTYCLFFEKGNNG
jgi:hypothetical protein